MIIDVTTNLKKALWEQFGTQEMPAEWDGRIYGGGKLSQRFWEYHKAIELLSIDKNTVLLDIGGGGGFFGTLIATIAKRVIILDKLIPLNKRFPDNVSTVREYATYDYLKRFFSQETGITHIVSLSMFEHVEHAVRKGIVRAINECFTGTKVVVSFEYHPRQSFFEQQLTARTLSDLFSEFTNFFPSDILSSPVLCENAYLPCMVKKDDHGILKWCYRKMWARTKNIFEQNLPAWYPLMVRFQKI